MSSNLITVSNKNNKNITKEEILNVFNENKGVSYEKATKLLNISKTRLMKKCEKYGILSEIRKLRFGEVN